MSTRVTESSHVAPMDNPASLQARYSIAQEVAAIGGWQWEAATDAVSYDEGARVILGLTSNEPVARSEVVVHVHPDDRDRHRAAWNAALDPDGNGQYFCDYRLVRGKSQKWLAAQARVTFVDRRPLRAIGVLRDITERRRTEAIFSGIVAIAADAIITIDEQQRITLFNDGAERIFGYPRAEVLGQRLEMLLPEDQRAGHAKHVERFGASDTRARRMAERSEIRGRRANGEVFPAEASISRLEVGSENLYTVVLRDISERKRVEELLARSNSELEARVSERTQELKAEMQRREHTQAQLVRTQRMEAFGQLTGGVAHDFNNILTVITGNLELLEMRLKDEKDRKLLKRASDAAEMGARLTARLLTFARRRQYETARLNLNDQVAGIADLLRRTLGEPIALETRFEPDVWPVRADPSEIENAILNLAINARDAMPKGGRLIIETANVSAEAGQVGTLSKLAVGDYVRLSVIDNGVGMTPEVLAHAFEPFFTTKQPGRGTGLGLSTIYGFSQELGGTVTIESESGRGTRVRLYLPRSGGPQIQTRQALVSEQMPQGKGECVLLVEDNGDVRAVTTSRLAGLGYRVIETDGGAEALKALQSNEVIDIVFSDIVMSGGMSGIDVANWIIAHRPQMKLLLTTGYAEEAMRPLAPELAHVKILRKPYSRSELARMLRDVIEG